MEFDLRSLLESVPGDTEKVDALLARYDTEGPTAELYADVQAFLSGRVHASLDAMGVPKLDENDPALDEAKDALAESTQKALDKFKEQVAGLEKQAAELEREVGSEVDAAHANQIRADFP